MEVLDLYDDLGNRLNETIIRGEKIPEGKNIMLSVAFIKNSKGEYLIQKASPEKDGKYTSTGGHVTHNEDGLTTIIRELEEEVSLTNVEDKIKYITTFKYPPKPAIFKIYLLENINIDVSKLKLQPEEVEQVMWLNTNEINNLIKQGLFLESHAYIFNNYIIKE